MHELSLCENIRSILEDEAKKQSFSVVRRVRLEIGALSGVEPDAMRFAFDEAMEGSVAEGAALEIVETPGAALCMICRKPAEVKARYDVCPHCGSHELQVTAGGDMRILDLEVL